MTCIYHSIHIVNRQAIYIYRNYLYFGYCILRIPREIPRLQKPAHCGTISGNIQRHSRMEDHMIVIIQKDTQEPALRQLAVRLMNQGVRIRSAFCCF